MSKFSNVIHSKAARIITFSALILFILGCIFYEPIKSYLVRSYQPHYEAKAPKQLRSEQLYKPVSYDMNKAKPVTLHQVIHARLHASQIHTVGQLIDPNARLHLPISLGVGSDTLMLSAGTMRPGEQMGQGNYALAGHHMLNKKALFTPLYLHAYPGQIIYTTDMHNIYAYRLYSRRVVNDHDVQVVNNIKSNRRPIITLVTCNSGELTSKRLILRGVLVRQGSLKKSNQKIRRALAGKTNNYKVLKGYHANH